LSEHVCHPRFDEARGEFERAAALSRNGSVRTVLLERAAACATRRDASARASFGAVARTCLILLSTIPLPTPIGRGLRALGEAESWN
jgi:hypothetical protein